MEKDRKEERITSITLRSERFACMLICFVRMKTCAHQGMHIHCAGDPARSSANVPATFFSNQTDFGLYFQECLVLTAKLLVRVVAEKWTVSNCNETISQSQSSSGGLRTTGCWMVGHPSNSQTKSESHFKNWAQRFPESFRLQFSR
jgi:hypothetical protein